MTHPTQVFLHNNHALRVEYRLDDARLMLWWSPLAGKSTDAAVRNFSNRDNHLDVFEQIEFPGLDVEAFTGCDYDPWHTVLHFGEQSLHLAVRHDAPVLLAWVTQPQTVNLKTARYDEQLEASDQLFLVRHEEPAFSFHFALGLGDIGEGAPDGFGFLRHCAVHAPWNSRYVEARLAPGQRMAIGVGLTEGEGPSIEDQIESILSESPDEQRAGVEAMLAASCEMGYTVSSGYPELEKLRRDVVRGLHSMIDESGAFRASLKAIYYLIWVRDAGFSFAFQAAAGWPHRLPELCRLLLDNPTTAQGEKVPAGRMFAQLINRTYGKYEEDGIYYVVWTLFTHWTQTGSREFLQGEDLALVEEALHWVERYIFDEDRGLFGEYFADETAAFGARDFGWDHAIGQPSGPNGIQHEGRKVVRSYDIYINLLLHNVYTMLAATGGGHAASYGAKAADLWTHLEPHLKERPNGLPVYGELLLEDGSRVLAEAFGPARSTYVWCLTMPMFAPLADLDAVRLALFREIAREPAMHWINGIASAMAAVDPWLLDEGELLELHQRLARETNTPGKYLPMGGAMPEKFEAPQGNLYHDIRPQGFAMGAWLAAWSSLGVRRLPYGLAVRPTAAFEELKAYPWRGKVLHFQFPPLETRQLALEVNGLVISGTLQVPENALYECENRISLVAAEGGPLLLRSTVQLNAVTTEEAGITYEIEAFGLSEMTFTALPDEVSLRDASGNEISTQVTECLGLKTLRFNARGVLELRLRI